MYNCSDIADFCFTPPFTLCPVVFPASILYPVAVHTDILPGQTEINCAGSPITLNLLDAMLHILNTHGKLTITNCSGANALLLGAYLQAIASIADYGNPTAILPQHDRV